MYNTAQELIDTLAAAPDVLRALLAGVSLERARAARGGDEGWSVVEVMCHLRDAEERALARMRAMRDAENPRLQGYDQEAWARERNYAGDDPQEALAAFLRLRRRHVADLGALPAAAWDRAGQHDDQGRVTISNHTRHSVAHDAAHIAQLARQLTARGVFGAEAD